MLTKQEPEYEWKQRCYTVIFEADTPAGRFFDLSLVWLIVISVTIVMLDSIILCTQAGVSI